MNIPMKEKDRKLIFHKSYCELERFLVHFLPYFSNAEVEDFQINEFGKVTLIKQGGKKEFIEDGNFTKEYLSTVMFLVCGMNNRIFSESNQQITAMLPINYFRFTGCMGSSVKSGIEISIRLNDDNLLQYTYENFGISELEFNYLVTNLIENQSSVFLIGGTGSGKTTFTNMLIQHISDNEVIKVVGDIHDYIFKPTQKYSELFAKSGEEYKDKFDLLMRINPDRIIIPELTTSNVDLILRSMNSGHKGFMLTMHSGASLVRVAEAFKQNMALSGKDGIDVKEIENSIKQNIDYLVFLNKEKGKRRIEKVIINNPTYLQEAKELNIFGLKEERNIKSTKMLNKREEATKDEKEKLGKKVRKQHQISIYQIIKDIQNGYSQRAIAKKYHISRNTIAKWLTVKNNTNQC